MSQVASIALNDIDLNEDFASAFEAMENTRNHLFITGKAGTGKSTLLQYFRLKTQKNIAVVAPTGIAAINIKGQTIHSFFQFKPDITPEAVSEIIVRKTKRNIYKALDCLVIDEVSMVRADMIDCIDAFLRIYGPSFNKPFGGVQVIFFGDLFQLPPVVRREEEGIFNSHYKSPFFFSSNVINQIELQILQLTKIYRQKDPGFIELLNAVRNNELTIDHLQRLNQRFIKGPQKQHDFYIALTTTNAIADRINNEQLLALPGQVKQFVGSITGDFDRKNLPTQEGLLLKIGAQVMLLTNDQDKRWVNGTLGKVARIVSDNSGGEMVMVELENGTLVDVKMHNWDLYQYYFDETNQTLASKVIGSFTQFPLKLAWAVTIHKAQGQTFDRVIIDLGFGTFAHGQTYVALSRCTNLEGIILKQPLSKSHILMDERVLDFVRMKL